MKTVLIGILVFFSSVILAQQMKANKPVICLSSEKAAQEIKQAGEKMIFNDGNIMTDRQSIILFFSNPQTGTWTLLESQGKMSCVLGYGKEVKL